MIKFMRQKQDFQTMAYYLTDSLCVNVKVIEPEGTFLFNKKEINCYTSLSFVSRNLSVITSQKL